MGASSLLALSLASVFSLVVPAAPASAALSVDIHIGQTYPNAYFIQPPRAFLIPATAVYYVDDLGYDMYRYGDWWYIDDGGYWYRAQSYRGPFLGVAFSSVPRTILNVPVAYRHQPYRPQVTYAPRDNRTYRSYDRSWSDNRTHRNQNRQWWNGGSNWSAAPRGDWVQNRDQDKDRGKGHGRGHGHAHGHGNGRGRGNK